MLKVKSGVGRTQNPTNSLLRYGLKWTMQPGTFLSLFFVVVAEMYVYNCFVLAL